MKVAELGYLRGGVVVSWVTCAHGFDKSGSLFLIYSQIPPNSIQPL